MLNKLKKSDLMSLLGVLFSIVSLLLVFFSSELLVIVRLILSFSGLFLVIYAERIRLKGDKR